MPRSLLGWLESHLRALNLSVGATILQQANIQLGLQIRTNRNT